MLITMRDWHDALRAEVDRHRIHPAGAATIHHWLGDIRRAADDGDAVEVARLTAMVRAKVRLERLWRIETWRAARTPAATPAKSDSSTGDGGPHFLRSHL